MSSLYYIRPTLKFIEELSLAKNEGKILQLTQDEILWMKKTLTSPLFSSESHSLRPEFLDTCFFKVNIEDEASLINLDQEYVSAKMKDAVYLRIKATTSIRLFWKNKKLSLKPGVYTIPILFPEEIEGAHKCSWLKERSITETRDEWIINVLKKNKTQHVLELGSGENPRLAKKIQLHLPRIRYTGMDKKKNLEQDGLNIHVGNFLKRLPPMKKSHTVILEEVIEHIPEKKVSILITALFENKATQLLLTTPNADFNVHLGVKLRRDDHHFEWTQKQLKVWIKQLKDEFGYKISYQSIGRKIQKVSPTWAVTIQKS